MKSRLFRWVTEAVARSLAARVEGREQSLLDDLAMLALYAAQRFGESPEPRSRDESSAT